MVRHFLLLITLSFFSAFTLAATFEAHVDRATVSEGDAIILTLQYNNNVVRGNPDLSPLNQQFDVINSNRKNSFQYINGKSESWTIWTVTIIPKRKGNLVIPSIEFEGERTKPIQINVTKVDPSIAQQDKEVFFHTETDVKTSYVQGQIVYSEKLYFSVPLDNSQLNEVAVEDAVLQPLGETRQYRTQLNGKTYDVYERRYVIFPQVSGELIIPGPRYSGEISNGRWRPGRPISVSEPPIRLQVLPQPANYPQATWLPAKNVELNAKWLGNTQQVKIGEPITLSLELKAQGLTSAQLPKIELPDLFGLKYYPEQAQKQESTSDSGITGSVTQNIAVVATQGGKITLPEIRIPWFNINLGRVEYATLPAQTLSVIGNAPATKTDSSTEQPQSTEASDTQDINRDASTIYSDQTPTSKFWPVVSLVFMLLWLITSYMLWRQKNRPSKQEEFESTKQGKLSGALKDIKKACRNNDAKQAREAILAWAHAQGCSDIISLQQVAQLHPIAEMKQALQELDYTLYSSTGNSAWQGEHLWQLIRNIKIENNKEASPLRPLYPSEA